MTTLDVLNQVYALVARREFTASMQALRIAKRVLPDAEGSVLLALYEAITNCLNDFLTELGEHGLQNRSMWEVDLADVDVAKLAGECAVAWKEVKRLRAAGLTTRELIEPYVGNWMDPIGSPDWLNRMKLAVPYHQDPEWISRVTSRLQEDV